MIIQIYRNLLQYISSMDRQDFSQYLPRNHYFCSRTSDERMDFSYKSSFSNKPARQWTSKAYRHKPETIKVTKPNLLHKNQPNINPHSRTFLRHTTHHPTKQDFLGSLTLDLLNTNLNNNKVQTQRQHTTNNTFYEPQYEKSVKLYGNDQYDRIAYQIKETTGYIEKLKRMKKCLRKQGFEKDENEETLPSFSKGTKYVSGQILKKKNQKHQFNTPKPQKKPIYNYEKPKRIFNLEVQSVIGISPNFKNKNSVTIHDFILQTKIGGGKFGTVHRAIHKNTNSMYALKKIPKTLIEQYMMIDQFILEFKIQSFLNHENIVQVYGMFSDKNFLYLIMEYMPDGTLYSLLKKKKQLPEKEVAIKIKQIAKAIAYMHSEGFVHRDLKPENIVMNGNNCKICDFGWATVCEDQRRQTYCGTFDYAAPQILEGGEYDKAVDLWCLGVICYELLLGKVPFYNISRRQTKYNILNVDSNKIKFPNSVSKECGSFIKCLLRKNPEQRLHYEQVLQHPFLKNAHEST